MRPIAALIGITLETPRADVMAAFYADAYGLTPLEPTEGNISFRGPLGDTPILNIRRSQHRRITELGWALRSRDDVDASAMELAEAGIAIIEAPGEDRGAYGFAIRDPDGTALRFAVLPSPTISAIPGNDRPIMLSHVVLNSPSPRRLIDFYTNVLGLVVSDAYERDLLTFLRCDQPQHHCLGIAPGDRPGVNHFAFDCGDLDALMRSVARLQQAGHAPLWGPGRHGPGGNIFCYFEDPDGFVPEVTCDVLQIEDPALWEPREWPRTPTNGNSWGTGGPSPRAIELMSGQR